LVNNGAVTNSGLAVRGNNSASFSGNPQSLTGTIEGIAGNSWSVSAWIYCKVTGGDAFCFGNVQTAGGCLSCGVGIDNLNTYSHNNLLTNAYSSAFPNDINNWAHIVWMYNSNSKERIIYRNGVKLTLTGTVIENISYIPNNTFSIGKVGFSSGYFWYNGYIDDLRVYTGTVLSQAQINEIYAGNPYYNLPTALTRYNTNPTNTQYQFEVVDEEQKLINRY
jgi:hypothetical protein